MNSEKIINEILATLLTVVLVILFFRYLLHWDFDIVFEAAMVSCIAQLCIVLVKAIWYRTHGGTEEEEDNDEDDDYDDDDDL